MSSPPKLRLDVAEKLARLTVERGSIGEGLFLLFASHVAVGIVMYAISAVAQLPYAIPLAISRTRGGATFTAKGIWIGIVATFIISAACWVGAWPLPKER